MTGSPDIPRRLMRVAASASDALGGIDATGRVMTSRGPGSRRSRAPRAASAPEARAPVSPFRTACFGIRGRLGTATAGITVWARAPAGAPVIFPVPVAGPMVAPRRLYTMPISHYCVSIDRMIAFKGLDVERVPVPYHDKTELLRATGQDYVPALVWDGQVVPWTRIPELLEAHQPAPTLYPGDWGPVAKVLENWGHQFLEERVWRAVVTDVPATLSDSRERWVFEEMREPGTRSVARPRAAQGRVRDRCDRGPHDGERDARSAAVAPRGAERGGLRRLWRPFALDHRRTAVAAQALRSRSLGRTHSLAGTGGRPGARPGPRARRTASRQIVGACARGVCRGRTGRRAPSGSWRRSTPTSDRPSSRPRSSSTSSPRSPGATTISRASRNASRPQRGACGPCSTSSSAPSCSPTTARAID